MSNPTGIFPTFKMVAVENKAASEEAGRPIFRDVEFIEIRIAGDRNTVITRKVSAEDRARWPDHYKRFSEGKSASVDGTPLDQWPALSVAKAAELRGLNIMTVEALATLPDGSLTKLGMGARALQAKARAFIEAAKDSAVEQRLAGENQKLREEIELLKEQMAGVGNRKAKKKAVTQKKVA